jgi:putative MATE family efflux protein
LPPGKPPASLIDAPIGPTMLRLSVPIILANVLQTAYAMTDTFWVGRLSAEAVAAVSLSFPINFLMIAVAGGLPIAGTVLIAQFRGRGDHTAMNHVAAQTMIMSFLFSLVLSIPGYFLAEPIMRFMGATPEVLPIATDFMRWTFLGFIFVFGFFAFQSLMRGLGVVYMPMWIVAGTVVLNFLLDPLFMFGWWGLPQMGAAGTAFATMCTQAIATAIGIVVLLRGRYGIHLKWRDFKPDFGFIRRVFWLGMPASVEQSTRALGMTIVTQLVASFGTVAVAAYGTGIRVLLCVMIPAMGLSMATSTMVGQYMGAGRVDRAERTNLIGCLLAFFGLLLPGAVLFVAARPFCEFFVPQGGEVIDQAAVFIRITAFTFGLVGLQQVLTGTFRGAGDTVAPMVLAIVSLWVLQFPLAYVLSKQTSLGLEGIWWAFALANIIAAAITVMWYLRGDWKRKRLLEEVKLEQQVREEAHIEEGSRF